MYTTLGNAVADVADAPHPLPTCNKRLLRDDQPKLRPESTTFSQPLSEIANYFRYDASTSRYTDSLPLLDQSLGSITLKC